MAYYLRLLTVIPVPLLLVGCTVGTPTPQMAAVLEPTDADLRIADEVVGRMQKDLAEDREVLNRYGNLISIEIEKVYCTQEALGESSYSPGSIQINCRCQFDKYSTEFNISVYPGKSFQTDTIMEPTAEFAEKPDSPLLGMQLVQRGNQVWLVRKNDRGESQLEIACKISCVCTHPELEPKPNTSLPIEQVETFRQRWDELNHFAN